MTKRLFVSASIALLLVGGVASARATQNPFDAWRQMFEQPIRHAMRWHPPKYRVHKPMLVKAAPNKAPGKLASLMPPANNLEERPVPAGSGLAALGVKSIALDPIEKGPCTVLDPVAVASLESGDVALTSKAILNDRMAETVANWVHD